jgi:AAT family amino acid transporter
VIVGRKLIKKQNLSVTSLPHASLRRGLNAIHVQLISLGGIIGSCYFLGIGDSIQNLGAATVCALLLGGFIVWLVANAMGELCVGLLRVGGFVSHARELVGRPWAAGVGWAYWVNWCAYVSSEMIAGSLIMHHFFPAVSTGYWAVLFGIVISLTNLSNVKYFGQIESVLTLVIIVAILFFCVMAVLIWFGIIGQQPDGDGFIGARHVLGNPANLMPVGLLLIIQRMVMILVNYQGIETIALSAAETSNPEQTIPMAVRNVSYRIIAAYVIPVILIVLILPRAAVGLQQSVFVTALDRYGFPWALLFFSVVGISAALSCANFSLYGAIRSLYSLAQEGLAPRFLASLNKNSVASWAIYATVLISWIFIPLLLFYESTSLYQWLLAVSGFSSAICWISIFWCQLRFRKKLTVDGKNAKDLPFAAPGFPYLSYFSIWIQFACLTFVVLDPELRSCLYLGLPSLLVPMAVIYLKDKKTAPSGAITQAES